MEKKARNLILLIVAVLVVLAGIFYFMWHQESQPGKLDTFAQCLKTKGVLFYGTFWCPHCQNQKAMFGNSKQYLPYVECSTPDSNGQLQVCKNANINVYPTWQFPDGTRQEGEVSLQDLAAKSGCQLPQ